MTQQDEPSPAKRRSYSSPFAPLIVRKPRPLPLPAHDAHLGILAVSLVIDYGVYSNTGKSRKARDEIKVEFKKSVAAQSGTFADTATLVEY